jgi:4-amino-4-deoxy-L-arabinose transferase-like glycosyltransferase
MTRQAGRGGIAWAGFLLAAVFVGLRVFDLTADPPPDLDGSGGIYFDEGMLAQGARNKVLFGGFFQDDWNDLYISPLLSLLKLAVLSLTGVGLWQVRIVPVAFGLGSLVLFYLMLRRGADRQTALLGVCLLGCNHVYGMFNRIGLTETPVCFFMLLTGWLWQEGMVRLHTTRGAPRFFFGAGVAAFVAYSVKGFPYFIPSVILASVISWGLLPAEVRQSRKPGGLREPGIAAGSLAAGIALTATVWYFAFYRRFAPSIEQAAAFYRYQQIPTSAAVLIKDLLGVPFLKYFSVTPVLLAFSVLFLGLGIVLWFHRRERLLPLDAFFACWFVAHFAMFAPLRYRPVRYYLPIVPPMVALAVRAMMLLGRRSGLRLPERFGLPTFALLFAWLAVCLFYGLLRFQDSVESLLARAGAPVSPGGFVALAAAGSLLLLSAAAVVTWRLAGRAIPIPPRVAVAACIALPAALSLGYDASHWGRWAAARRHVIRDTSREFGALPADTYVAGLGATTISLENRNRAIHVHERFFNGNDTFARYPLTHLFMGGLNREVEFWYRRYPGEMKPARVQRVIAVKWDHYYLYGLVDPTAEAVEEVRPRAGAAAGRAVALISVRNNDPRHARDIEGAILLHSVGGGSDVLLPAAVARAVPPGQRATLGVSGPLPPGDWRLLATVPPALEHVFEAENLQHRTGRRVHDPRASNSEVWEAAAGEAALFGPYLRYQPGLLRAAFRLQTREAAAGTVAILRVTTDRGSTVLAERRADARDLDPAGSFTEIVLPAVVLERELVLEFTAEAGEKAKVSFDAVRVTYTPGAWWRESVLAGGSDSDGPAAAHPAARGR